jgi:hypothetical protein
LIGPDEFFDGHNPYSTYVCQFRKMFDKAIAEGISKETFEGIWMILGGRPEVVAEPDNDCKQFKAEKMTWDHLCRQPIS